MSEWSLLLNEVVGKRRGCDLVVDSLVEHGVDVIFGLPAESINALFDAARKNSSLRVVTVRHEGNAALMASAFGKLTGRPAAVTATNGPGATHLVVGCRDAWVDGSPMVVLPGAVRHALEGTGAFQEVDSAGLLGSMAASAHTAASVDGLARLGSLIARATARRAPIVLSVAPEVLTAGTRGRPRPRAAVLAGVWRPEQAVLERASRLLEDAERPAMLLGDLRNAPAGFVDRLRDLKPTSTIVMDPAAMQSPGWGDLTAARCREAGGSSRAAVEEADLVVVVGDLPATWLPQCPAHIVHLTDRPPTSPLSDDALALALCGAVPQGLQQQLDDRFLLVDHVCPPVSAGRDGRSAAVLDDLLPGDATVALEPGRVTTLAFDALEERDRLFTGSFEAGTVGYAIPAALGAKLAFPDRPACAVVDGRGWLEGHMELLSSRKHGLGVSVIVVATADVLPTVHQQAASLGLRVVSPQDGHPLPPDSVVVLPDGAVCGEELSTHSGRGEIAALVTLAAQELGAPFLTVDRRQRTRPEATAEVDYAESVGMYASGIAKSGDVVPVLCLESEVDFLRQLNGIYDAAFDRAPLVVVTVEQGWHADSRSVLKQAAHVVVDVDRVDDVRRAITDAHAVAHRFHVVVHVRVAVSGYTGVHWSSPGRVVPAAAAPSAPSDVLARIEELFLAAERPVIVVGGGAAGVEVTALAQRWAAPIVATMRGGRGVDTAPLFRGYVGSSGHAVANKLLRNADAVLVLGLSSRGAAFELLPARASIVDVNVDPEPLHARGGDICVCADAATLIRQILDVPRNGAPRHSRLGEPTSDPRELDWRAAESTPTLRGELRPSFVIRVLDRCAEAYPGEVGWTADVGLNTLWLYRFRRSHRTTLWTGNFATMGFSVPAAVACAARRGCPAVAVTGDGGAGMMLPALSSLGGSNPPVLVVVLNNSGLGAIRYEQEIQGWPEYNSAFCDSDFARYAVASGWAGRRVTTDAGLEAAVAEFFRSPRPMLIDAVCSADEAPVPALLPSAPRVASMAFSWVRQGRKGWSSAGATLAGLRNRWNAPTFPHQDRSSE